MKPITIIGAGLAGSEAAWQLAERGIQVRLFEMRPQKMTPAHHSGKCAELVCSNSFRADDISNAVGLLHAEMRYLNSLIMRVADETRLPAGGALAVDRELFSEKTHHIISSHANIELIAEEVCRLPSEGIVLIASGPLTSDPLYAEISRLTGEEHLSFYDAIAPVVDAESINMDTAFWKSRYDKNVAEGEQGDYINCPMNRAQYETFIQEMLAADKVSFKDFEDVPFFEGCMPIEVMAERGIDTPRFGPMKPVGLEHPETGEQFHAVVQLRQDNRSKSLMNIVGFQTKMTYGEQKRIFRMIPGLEKAEFFRLGSLHRNAFIRSPALLDRTLRLKKEPRIFFAGQITGVEGYVESAAMGLMAAHFITDTVNGNTPLAPADDTAHGALLSHISGTRSEGFQPMNINFGLLPTAAKRDGKRRLNKKERRTRVSEQAIKSLTAWHTKL
ncbi:MAG: methylenetetrahydrofolate--tRNA-(uracil(54)-C(5))-methyltransferase (FADH(2)-oxidizing) TrmFO [Mariprofundaceae bacterium]